MRIISGKYRKKRILPPKNLKVRPTTDIAKEGLFNILSNNLDIESLKVLDLFSGTGSISYEFASRGCNNITSIELNYRNFSFIRKTVNDLSFNQIKVIKTNVFVYLKQCREKYDLIFADPPYNLNDIEKIHELIFKNSLLNKEGLLIIEHSKRIKFTGLDGFFDKRIYGSVNFSFFRKSD